MKKNLCFWGDALVVFALILGAIALFINSTQTTLLIILTATATLAAIVGSCAIFTRKYTFADITTRLFIILLCSGGFLSCIGQEMISNILRTLACINGSIILAQSIYYSNTKLSKDAEDHLDD